MTVTISVETVLALAGFAVTWVLLALLALRIKKELTAARIAVANLQIRMAEMEVVVKPAEVLKAAMIKASSNSRPPAPGAGTPDASDPA